MILTKGIGDRWDSSLVIKMDEIKNHAHAACEKFHFSLREPLLFQRDLTHRDGKSTIFMAMKERYLREKWKCKIQ